MNYLLKVLSSETRLCLTLEISLPILFTAYLFLLDSDIYYGESFGYIFYSTKDKVSSSRINDPNSGNEISIYKFTKSHEEYILGILGINRWH